MDESYVIGLDYGTDSVRALVLDASNGRELNSAVHYYRRWKEGKFCNPSENIFRQHPLDYIEGLEASILDAIRPLEGSVINAIKAISIDTTGSTPCPVDKKGKPLALNEKYSTNPNAMFILWKDHSSIKEAEEINQLAGEWEINYLQYEGGVYSSEWFWAKILHILRIDEEVRKNAWSWVEHCDWIPAVLTGVSLSEDIKRSQCAAGHKAMWHESWEGLPDENFLKSIDPLLGGLRKRLYEKTYTSNQSAGIISKAWADKLGLNENVKIGIGAFDAHMGAVGGEIEPYALSRVMGTSTCDILVAPQENFPDKTVSGICGQVSGSVIPGMMGLEAGQSSFGDAYAWFRDILAWPIKNIVGKSPWLKNGQKDKFIAECIDRIIPELSNQAASLDPSSCYEIALDWLNGRRTPDANQSLKAAIAGLSLGTDAPKIFRAIVEATAFGAKAIVDRFIEEGVPINSVIGLGGVAKKSPFVMQVLANVLNMPIKVARSEQTCALGAGMFAATVAGIYTDVLEAKEAMGQGFEKIYEPEPEMTDYYQHKYQQYLTLGKLIEANLTQK